MTAGLVLAGVALAAAKVWAAGVPDAASPQEITIGFIPMLGPEKTKQKFQPLLDHLQKSLGLKVNALVPASYVDLIGALKDSRIEFAFMGPTNYIEAHKITGAKAVAVELSADGKPGYRSIIIASKKSGLTSLDQAQGKIFAFTDPDSTSGFVIPNVYFIKERKQTPAAFASKTVMAGNHNEVVKGVAADSYAIGATNDLDFARACSDLKLSPAQFTVVWRSELIPGAPMVARADISPAFQKQFVEALLAINRDKKALEKMQMGGFIEAADSDFDYIRELENFLPKDQPLK